MGYSIYAAWREGSDKEKKAADQLARGDERERKCREKLWADTQRKIDALKGKRGGAERAERLAEQAEMRESTLCADKREETDNRLWDQLINLRTKRRAKAMGPLKKRLETLFVGY